MRAVPLVLVLLLAVAAPAVGHVNHATGTTQVSPDGVVYVEKAFVTDPVWLVLYGDSGGAEGEPIGHVLLGRGDRSVDVPVTVADDAWGDGPLTVHVDLYYDDGDGEFDPADDVSLVESGQIPSTSFVVEPGEDRAYVGVEDVDTLRTRGSVVVRRAILPADGHLVIHDDSRGSPAEVVGHVPLAAGDHEDVEVDLDEAFYRDQSGTVRLHATVYADDGDGEFDDGDRPVSAGGENVSSGFRVVKQDSNATPTSDESDLVTTPTPVPRDGSGPEGPDGSDGTPGDADLGALADSDVAPVAAGVAVAGVALAVLLGVGWLRRRR